MEKAAKLFDYDCPQNYKDQFHNDTETHTDDPEHLEFSILFAKDATSQVVDDLMNLADSTINDSNITKRDLQKVEVILEEFALIIPTNNAETLPNLINAAWKAYNTKEKLWENSQYNVKVEDIDNLLKELILKSIEVLEYQHQVEAQNDY